MQAQIQEKQAKNGKFRREGSVDRHINDPYQQKQTNYGNMYQQKAQEYSQPSNYQDYPSNQSPIDQIQSYQPAFNQYQPQLERAPSYNSYENSAYNKPQIAQVFNPQFDNRLPDNVSQYDRFQSIPSQSEAYPTNYPSQGLAPPNFPSQGLTPPNYPQKASEISQEYEKPNFVRDNSITRGNIPPRDEEKMSRYREELQKQMDDQKRRKDEEKRKTREEEDKAEQRFLIDIPNETKPLVTKKVDPNRPSEDHPGAQRYQELAEKAKVQVKSNEATALENFNGFPPTKPNYKFQQKQDIISEEPPMKPSAFNFNQIPSQINPINSPQNYDYNQMPLQPKQFQNPPSQMYNYQDQPMNSFVPRPGPNYPQQSSGQSHDIKNAYMKEIQEIKVEREKARDQMLEMREMMLKEREKQLENMLMMVKMQPNLYMQTQQSRPYSYGSNNPQMEPNEFIQPNPNNQNQNLYENQYNNPYDFLGQQNSPNQIPPQQLPINQFEIQSSNNPQSYDYPINKDAKQGLFGNPNANLIDLKPVGSGNQNLMDMGRDRDTKQKIFNGQSSILPEYPRDTMKTVNMLSHQPEDMFEKSLSSTVK